MLDVGCRGELALIIVRENAGGGLAFAPSPDEQKNGRLEIKT